MSNLKITYLLVFSLVLLSCASSHVLINPKRPAISPNEVKLYLTPPKKYEEIAIVNASSRASWSFSDQGRSEKVIERLKSEAASLGANGVILQGVGDQNGPLVGNTNPSTGNTVLVPVRRKSGSGIAIYVIEK